MSEATTQKEDAAMLKYMDAKQYQAEFLLDPQIESDTDYTHLDKNLAITNLLHNAKAGINEPDQARSILKALHILNNVNHFEEVERDVLIGYKEVKEEKGIIHIPQFERKKFKIPLFQKAYHALKSEFISFVNTAAARKGHRINAAITNRLVKEESLQDKTEVKSKWFGFGAKKQP